MNSTCFNHIDIDQQPLVSVIIPSYNHEKFVEESILSVINQTYKNIELIVIDDGSKDNSKEILRRLQNQYNFTLVCRENKGLSATLNEAIKNYANGKYIRCLASDDYWPVNSISDLVGHMENHPDHAMCFGWSYIVDSENKIFNKYGIDKEEKDITFEKLLEDNFIVAPTTIFLKKVFDEVGGYDESLPIEDWDFWLKIRAIYPIGHFNSQSVAYYRKHPNSTTYKAKLMAEAREVIYAKWKNKVDKKLYNRARSKYLFNYFRIYAIKHKRVAVDLLLKYRFQYFDIQLLKAFIKGCVNLIFYWK